MTHHDNPDYSTLIERIPTLRRLDTIRARARILRDRGLQSLVAGKRSAFGDSPSPTTRVLFRRAKQLAWHLGVYDKCGDAEPSGFPAWPTITLGNDGPQDTLSQDILSCDQGAVPVFFATQYLRARLGNLEKGHITSDCIRAYYRIVREIYTMRRFEMSVGGVAAGGRNATGTLFVTAECSRALNQLADGLARTARFLAKVLELARTRQYTLLMLQKGPRGRTFKKWRPPDNLIAEVETRFLTSLRSLLASRADSMFLVISPGTSHLGFDDLIGRITDSALLFVSRSVVASEVQQEIKKVQVKGFEEIAHNIAQTAIWHAQDRFSKASAKLEKVDPANRLRALEHSTDIVRTLLEGFVQRIRTHQLVMQNSARSALFESFFLATQGGDQRSFEDLVFSADVYGSNSRNWSDSIFASTVETLEQHLDSRGRLPSGHPFSVESDGGQRHVAIPHVIASFAHILQHAPVEVHADTVEKLLRHFDDTGLDLTDAYGWHYDDGNKRSLSLWYSAASCIAIHRIVTMLSHRINAYVKTHFQVFSSAELGKNVPSLERLMWTDVGTTKVLREAGVDAQPCIHDALYGMNNALQRPAARARQLPTTNSILLYGPPGTGKSTLLESLAVTSSVDLVVVTPSDFVFEGLESLERLSSTVMEALGMLSETVILFDEFETMLEARMENSTPQTKSVLDFLTGNMLPKLSRLNRRARDNRLVYAAATNFVSRMDEAAIREGRFDRKLCVFYPDPDSRLLKLLQAMDAFGRKPGRRKQPVATRVVDLVCESNFVSAAKLSHSGWFAGRSWTNGDVARYLLQDSAAPIWPSPKQRNITFEPGRDPGALALQRQLVSSIVGVQEGSVRRSSERHLARFVEMLDERNEELVRGVRRLNDAYEDSTARATDLANETAWSALTSDAVNIGQDRFVLTPVVPLSNFLGSLHKRATTPSADPLDSLLRKAGDLLANMDGGEIVALCSRKGNARSYYSKQLNWAEGDECKMRRVFVRNSGAFDVADRRSILQHWDSDAYRNHNVDIRAIDSAHGLLRAVPSGYGWAWFSCNHAIVHDAKRGGEITGTDLAQKAELVILKSILDALFAAASRFEDSEIDRLGRDLDRKGLSHI